jgi:putative membrane protein insertion efficiency factor
VLRVPTRVVPWLVAALVGGLFAWDASAPPSRQWTTRTAIAAIHLYQRTASSKLPSIGIQCRFTPTCSRYSVAVLERYGIVRGSALTLLRLARCGPWTAAGTEDPPPANRGV